MYSRNSLEIGNQYAWPYSETLVDNPNFETECVVSDVKGRELRSFRSNAARQSYLISLTKELVI